MTTMASTALWKIAASTCVARSDGSGDIGVKQG